MHMGNELLTPSVAGAFYVAAGAGIAYASVKARKELDEKRVPLLGVLGAFVFAAQMVNFPIFTGATGHFVGGALLAIVLGPHAAALSMAAIVILQCLIAKDGGLLSLGANIFNMAIVGPYAAHAVFRTIVPSREGGEAVGRARVYAATFAAAMVSILAGAILLPVEVVVSGVCKVPLHVFAGVMAGVHTLIGAAEGVITFAAVVALARMRPDIVPGVAPGGKGGGGLPLKTVAASILVAAVLVGGFLSLAASESPDGLEWTLMKKSVVDEETHNPAARVADDVGERISLFPDYNRPGERWYWTTVSGILGALLVLGVAFAAGRMLRRSSSPTVEQGG
jgi:cobalt/nickel transport system permease protein